MPFPEGQTEEAIAVDGETEEPEMAGAVKGKAYTFPSQLIKLESRKYGILRRSFWKLQWTW
jgi:hypothetical protein